MKRMKNVESVQKKTKECSNEQEKGSKRGEEKKRKGILKQKEKTMQKRWRFHRNLDLTSYERSGAVEDTPSSTAT